MWRKEREFQREEGGIDCARDGFEGGGEWVYGCCVDWQFGCGEGRLR